MQEYSQYHFQGRFSSYPEDSARKVLMGRRSLHTKEEIKALAISATVSLLERHGYMALSTRKIASAMGYTVGSLYLVFRNLDELILHVNAQTLDTLIKRLCEADKTTTPESGVLALAETYIRFAAEHHQLWSLLFEHRLQDGTPLPAWYEEKVARVFGLVEDKLKATGSALSTEQRKLAARALWSSVHGISVLCLNQKYRIAGVNSVHELTRTLVENYLTGLYANALTTCRGPAD